MDKLLTLRHISIYFLHMHMCTHVYISIWCEVRSWTSFLHFEVMFWTSFSFGFPFFSKHRGNVFLLPLSWKLTKWKLGSGPSRLVLAPKVGPEPNFHLGPEPNFQIWPFLSKLALSKFSETTLFIVFQRDTPKKAKQANTKRLTFDTFENRGCSKTPFCCNP